jgi:hypothetical protein
MHVRTPVSALAPALASALTLVLGAPALAQQESVQDFKLPVPTPTATSRPDVQGPVDPDAPLRTAPRPIGTPTPTPSPRAQPSAAPSQPPLVIPTSNPSPVPSRAAQQSAATRLAPPRAPATPDTSRETAAAGAADSRQALGDEAASIAAPASGIQSPPILPPANEGQASLQADGGLGALGWFAALLAVLVAVGAGAWHFRRRQAAVPVPAIEPPLARAPSPAPPPAPSPRPAAAPVSSGSSARGPAVVRPIALALGAQPVRFSRSMMNATFAYKLVLENQGPERWEDIAVEADLVTAHGKAPIGEQIADPAVPLAPAKAVAALEPGETVELAGEVRLPLQQVRAIPQGSAAVYVPLLRLRVASKGRAAIARTFLIGQLPDRQGGRLRPFRLDEMPQSYPAIGLRALD